MSTISVGVRLPSALHAKLLDHTEKTLLSKSEVIVEALSQHLSCMVEAPLAQKLAEVEAKIAQFQKQLKISS
jgi:predicted transcriptional regulator